MNEESVLNEKGEALERLAFTFCKIATFCVVFQGYALPLAALLSAGFFAFTFFSGKKDTRCIGKHPLLISVFWLMIFGIWTWRRII